MTKETGLEPQLDENTSKKEVKKISPRLPDTAPDRSRGRRVRILFIAVIAGASAYAVGPRLYHAVVEKPSSIGLVTQAEASTTGPDSIRLSEKQLDAVKIAPVASRNFEIIKTAVGSIDFNEDKSVQVFTPYQGRIVTLYAKLGDTVKAGDTLFTIDSPDLLNAASNLIQAAGVLQLTNRALVRAQKLLKAGGGAEKDYEQAVSDQQTAEGNLKAARDAVRIFGRSDKDIDRIIADRHVDSTLVVPSPISGLVTARNAQTGLFVQPGNTPAPFTIADISTMWLNSYVVESEIPAFGLGQELEARVLAYPDRVFEGKVTVLGAMVDPNTHRLLVRSEIKDPDHLLRPGMFAKFVIRTGKTIDALAIPAGGIVREGDGTMSAWIARDDNVFSKRTVDIGLQQRGYDEIREGIKAGEKVVTEGAVFLSNMLAGGATD
ncbi:MAG TPA: efflux RND transporter periplasmic adaptor subunit [Methylocella sp.]|nr:efflux RND transporter periplasmic adaptor subunit [Methylocella sp.]